MVPVLTSDDYDVIFNDSNPMNCFKNMMKKLQEESSEPISVEQYLDTVLDMDILLDTGDSGSEFLMNTLSPSWGGRVYGYNYHISDWASIAWLTHQQGYKKQELNSYIHVIDNEYERRKLKHGFLYSAAYEIWHEMSDHNQLCFLVKMKLKDALLLTELSMWGHETKKWNGYIILDKKTRTGFYDPSSGSGSLMGIQLEKDVKLPVKHIHFAEPDCVREYSVKSIWCDPSMWDNGGVKLIHMPKKFRKDLERRGFEEHWVDRNVSNYIVKMAQEMV